MCLQNFIYNSNTETLNVKKETAYVLFIIEIIWYLLMEWRMMTNVPRMILISLLNDLFDIIHFKSVNVYRISCLIVVFSDKVKDCGQKNKWNVYFLHRFDW